MSKGRLVRILAVLTVLSASMVLGHGSASAASKSNPRFMFAGHGWGTSASGGGFKAGKTANVVMWCRTKPPIHASNSAASVKVPGALDIGEIATNVDGTVVPNGKKSVATTNVQNVSILGGLITADQLKAVSTTVHTATGFALSDAGAVWSNINLLGQPLPLPSQVPDPNTKVDIPGVGYMILNEQVRDTRPHRAVLRINMLHVHVTLDNPVLGTKSGTNIVVGHAASGLLEVGGPLGAKAFTTNLNAANGLLSAGPSAALFLPCAGTDGKTLSNSIGSFGVPGVLSLANAKNSGSGVVTPHRVQGQIQSSAESVRLMGGLISADAVQAHVRAVRAHGQRTFKDLSTGFTNLVVNGQAFGGDAPPNTKVGIPGVGTLWIHRVVHRANSLRVTMLELKISQAGVGLPVGSDVRIVSTKISIY
jgi:hypothetical protein